MVAARKCGPVAGDPPLIARCMHSEMPFPGVPLKMLFSGISAWAVVWRRVAQDHSHLKFAMPLWSRIRIYSKMSTLRVDISGRMSFLDHIGIIHLVWLVVEGGSEVNTPDVRPSAFECQPCVFITLFFLMWWFLTDNFPTKPSTSYSN